MEWAEIFAATTKAGLIAVPVNFRLVGREISYLIEDAGAAAVIVEDGLLGGLEEVRTDLSVPAGNLIRIAGHGPGRRDACPAGYRDYEDLLAMAADREPAQPVLASDPWTLMYTSGTTGRPKGVLRSHKAATHLSLVTDIELGVHRRGRCPPGHADVPRELAQLLRRLHLFAAARCPSTRAVASTPNTASARSPRVDRPSPRSCRPTTP